MSYLEKFHLDKTAKKYLCPQCGKKSFVIYVHADTLAPVNEYAFGRCDRENSCSYHVKPDYKTEGGSSTGGKTIHKNIIFPNEAEVLKKTMRAETPVHRLIASLGVPLDFIYDCGLLSDKNSNAVYLMRNEAGKLCNAKWMMYQENGKRLHKHPKDENIPTSWSLKQPEQRNEYVQEVYTTCLFMEHLLDPAKKKTVYVVESEKSSVIARFFFPQFDWVSCASANGLSDGNNDTADKIKPLVGRRVVWLNDADAAGRGKFVMNEKTKKDEWVPCSSVRNGVKYFDDFHICDLFPERTDGYDIGDFIIDWWKGGKKNILPDLAPTWSKHKPKYSSYVAPHVESIKRDYEEGVQVGEHSRVTDMSQVFAWMRGFINAFYGWPNDGKGTFFNFMALNKSKHDKWKWLMMKQEDMSSHQKNGRAEIDANKIYLNLVWMLTGQTPYDHFAKRNIVSKLEWDALMTALEWVKAHFFVIHPRDRRYKNVFDECRYYAEVLGIDGILIDPFKSLILPDNERGDERLTKVFIEAKECALETNTCWNFISHPRSLNEVKYTSGERKGYYKVVDQYMQLGGSAWDINLDSQYSVYRPYRHENPRDTKVEFYNLKQRQAEIVGVDKGVFDQIDFDRLTQRYFFNGVCPLDGSLKKPVQTTMDLAPSWKKDAKKKKDKTAIEFAESDAYLKDWVKADEFTPDPNSAPMPTNPDDVPF